MQYNNISSALSKPLEKSRINWIDWAKAYLILFMVLGHTGYHCWVYYFHMPAFFMISGYLYKPKKALEFFKALIIPLCCFSFIFLCYRLIYKVILTNNISFSDWLYGGITYYITKLFKPSGPELFRGDWFIVTLLFLHLIFNQLHKLKIDLIGGGFISIICILLLSIVPYFYPSALDHPFEYSIYFCSSAFPFYFTGYIIGNNVKIRAVLFNNNFMIVSGCLAAFMVLFQPYVDMYYNEFGIGYWYFFILACLISLFFFNICDKFKYNSFIKDIASGTILILGMHVLLLIPFTAFYNHFNFKYVHMYTLFESILIVLICYPLIKFSQKRAPFLIGKVKRTTKL